MTSFSIIKEEHQEIVTLRLKGFLNADTSPQFESVLQDMINRHLFSIIVDFSNLEYISSAGVGCFIGNIRTIRKNGGDIVFINMPPKTQRVFQLLDFQDFFRTFDDESSAVASFKTT